MIGRPGSAPWLLGHELRLFYINASGARSRQRSALASGTVWLVVLVAMHGLAYLVLDTLDTGAGLNALAPGLTGIMLGAFTLMLSTGLKGSVEALFERGDLDLLLSSPLSSRSILTARLAGIAAGTCLLYLFFLAPFAHVGFALGQPRWLGIYPAILSMAASAASLSMLLTLTLVRSLGVRRTRVVAQVLGALAGALLFLISQAFGTPVGDVANRVLSTLAPHAGPAHPLWIPGRAALGSAPDALAMAAIGAAAFLLTVSLAHRFFVQGVQLAVSAVRVAPPPAGGLRFRFGRGLTRTILTKEWRLILRDPHLISQVLLQLLYMLPLFLPFFLDRTPSPAASGAALTFLCAALSASLGWLVISAEDAPDLLRAAPCSEGTIRRAKVAAAALPPLALVLLPLAWFSLTQPLAAAVMLGAASLASINAALVVLWLGRPAARGDFKVRGKANLLGNVLELLGGASWAGLAYALLARGQAGQWSGLMLAGGAAALSGALLVPVLAWLLRRRPA